MRLYQIDAFTTERFRGNPAAVCPLEEWIEDDLMQSIALENNLSETAFFVDSGDHHELRWFTPSAEVDLCGHATLASAWAIFNLLAPERDRVDFETRSGRLRVEHEDDLLLMDFPARPPEPVDAARALVEGLGREPEELMAGQRDYLVVYGSEDDVRKLKPDFARLRTLDRLGIIASAPGDSCDFVSRFFAPGVGVDEDPVTGSAHCTLIPYWSDRLGRTDRMEARQVSRRGGRLVCQNLGDRVLIGGRAVLYMTADVPI